MQVLYLSELQKCWNISKNHQTKEFEKFPKMNPGIKCVLMRYILNFSPQKSVCQNPITSSYQLLALLSTKPLLLIIAFQRQFLFFVKKSIFNLCIYVYLMFFSNNLDKKANIFAFLMYGYYETEVLLKYRWYLGKCQRRCSAFNMSQMSQSSLSYVTLSAFTTNLSLFVILSSKKQQSQIQIQKSNLRKSNFYILYKFFHLPPLSTDGT